jgi:hypothetical protein
LRAVRSEGTDLVDGIAVEALLAGGPLLLLNIRRGDVASKLLGLGHPTGQDPLVALVRLEDEERLILLNRKLLGRRGGVGVDGPGSVQRSGL